MRPKTLVIVVALLLLTVAGVAYYEYAKREALRSCQISIADVSVKSLGPTNTTLEIKLNIYNPNSIPATLDRASYSLYANEVYLGNGTIPRKYDIPPGSTVTIVTPFELSYPGSATDHMVLYNKRRKSSVENERYSLHRHTARNTQYTL
jgi:LEA14-like dessication related protein